MSQLCTPFVCGQYESLQAFLAYSVYLCCVLCMLLCLCVRAHVCIYRHACVCILTSLSNHKIQNTAIDNQAFFKYASIMFHMDKQLKIISWRHGTKNVCKSNRTEMTIGQKITGKHDVLCQTKYSPPAHSKIWQ